MKKIIEFFKRENFFCLIIIKNYGIPSFLNFYKFIPFHPSRARSAA